LLLHMAVVQVLFGSYPIASCRQPYAVVRYLASASWPRLQHKLALSMPGQQQQQQQQQQEHMLEELVQHKAAVGTADVTSSSNDVALQGGSGGTNSSSSSSSSSSSDVALQGGSDGWSPWMLCEALAEKRHWVLPRSGRLDTYRCVVGGAQLSTASITEIITAGLRRRL
jgi:hypothetical protein